MTLIIRASEGHVPLGHPLIRAWLEGQHLQSDETADKSDILTTDKNHNHTIYCSKVGLRNLGRAMANFGWADLLVNQL